MNDWMIPIIRKKDVDKKIDKLVREIKREIIFEHYKYKVLKFFKKIRRLCNVGGRK